jgi:hypothetical protein
MQRVFKGRPSIEGCKLQAVSLLPQYLLAPLRAAGNGAAIPTRQHGGSAVVQREGSKNTRVDTCLAASTAGAGEGFAGARAGGGGCAGGNCVQHAAAAGQGLPTTVLPAVVCGHQCHDAGPATGSRTPNVLYCLVGIADSARLARLLEPP